MNMETKIRRNVLTFDQQLAIYNFLKNETVLTVINAEEKVVAYLDGWSDERVASVMAEKLGSAVTAYNVQGIRAGQFGDLRVQSPTEQRLTKLEQQNEALSKRITELQGGTRQRRPHDRGQGPVDHRHGAQVQRPHRHR